MEKANVTLYTVIGDSNRIVEAIRERFKEMTKEFVCEDETIDLTLPDGTHVIFSIKHRMSKPDFIASHISGKERKVPLYAFPMELKNIEEIGCKKFNQVKNRKARK